MEKLTHGSRLQAENNNNNGRCTRLIAEALERCYKQFHQDRASDGKHVNVLPNQLLFCCRCYRTWQICCRTREGPNVTSQAGASWRNGGRLSPVWATRAWPPPPCWSSSWSSSPACVGARRSPCGPTRWPPCWACGRPGWRSHPARAAAPRWPHLGEIHKVRRLNSEPGQVGTSPSLRCCRYANGLGCTGAVCGSTHHSSEWQSFKREAFENGHILTINHNPSGPNNHIYCSLFIIHSPS